jgi:hypothetical protein
MTRYLTRIALGTVALFFVCVIAGAAIIRSSSKRNTGGEQAPPAAETEAGSAAKKIVVHSSNLALQETDPIENIPYYGGKISDEEPTHNFRRTGTSLTGSSPVIYLER